MTERNMFESISVNEYNKEDNNPKQNCFTAICLRPHNTINMTDTFSEQDGYYPKTVYGYYSHLYCIRPVTDKEKSRNLRYFGILSSVQWYFITDVSGQTRVKVIVNDDQQDATI